MKFLRSLGFAALIGSAALAIAAADAAAPAAPAQTADEAALPKGQWTPIFNGKDLTGWTPKIKGFPLGENHLDTFRVVDGKLVVSYDKYDKFADKFGHLFYKGSYGHYRLRAEYRFVGKQVPQGPGWAIRNNGFMVLGQPAETMTKDQPFPVSIESQLLGTEKAGQNRPTLAVCTPGTNCVHKGKFTTAHGIQPDIGMSFPENEWVTIELEVNGSKSVKHFIDGKQVHEVNDIQLDPKYGCGDGAHEYIDAQIKAKGKLIESGSISIQGESAPIEFRKIEIMPL
ncbi:MAG: hypothetical protein RL095_840 [Verrucomicrobiota bacterium]|jgi:hypothetical protein